MDDYSFLKRVVIENGFKNYELFNNKIKKSLELENLYLKIVNDVFEYYKNNQSYDFSQNLNENLDFLKKFFEDYEEYEKCDEIVKIQNKLKF